MEEKRKEVEQGANGARPVGRPFGGRPKVRPQSAARQETTRRNGRPMLKCTPEAVQLAENWVEEVRAQGGGAACRLGRSPASQKQSALRLWTKQMQGLFLMWSS